MKKLVPLWMSLLFFPVTVLISGLNISVDAVDKSAEIILSFTVMALISAVVLYIGYGAGYLFSGGKNRSVLFNLATGVIPGLVLIPAVILVKGSGFTVFSVFLAFMYTVGNAVFRNSLQKCVEVGYLVTSSVLYVIVGISVLINYELSAEYLVIPMIAMIILWIFLQNQRAVSNAMTSRNYDERYLPKDIRAFNLRLTAVIGVIVLFCLLTYRIFSAFLRSLLYKAGHALGIILSKGEFYHDFSGNAVMDDMTADGSLPAASPLSGILQKICIVLCSLFLIALTVYAVRKGVLKKLIKVFVADIRRLFSVRWKKENSEDISKGYTDVVENLAEDTEDTLSKRKMRRMWKSGYEEYRKMPDNPEKLRFGYSLVLSWLRFKHPEIKKSETPYEISEKTDISEVKNFTERYYPVRYGYSDTAGEDFAAAGSALEKIKKSLR